MLEQLAEKLPVIFSNLGCFGKYIGKSNGSRVFKAVDYNGNTVLRTIKNFKMAKKITREPLKGMNPSFNEGYLTTIEDYSKGLITKTAYQGNKNKGITEIQSVVRHMKTDTIISESRVISNPIHVIRLDHGPTSGKVYSEYKKAPNNKIYSLGTSTYNIPTCSLPVLKV